MEAFRESVDLLQVDAAAQCQRGRSLFDRRVGRSWLAFPISWGSENSVSVLFMFTPD